MPEIFIPEEPRDADEEARYAESVRLARETEELLQIAAFTEWIETQSETVRALGAELIELQTARKMSPRFMITEVTLHGRTIWTAVCANGIHQSRQSAEHALFLLVDSFRTRIEDKPETHARVQAWGGSYAADVKTARRHCAAVAQRIREQNPNMPGEQRDALVLAQLGADERRLREPPPEPPSPAPRGRFEP